MAKTNKAKGARRFRSAGGRVTLKPCVARANDAYCAPLNHIIAEDSDYWTCSCGRRYSRNAHKQFLKDNPEWRSGETTPSSS